MKCCSRSSLKPARPMCDGRPFASPLFRRLAGRGLFFRGFPFRWALHFVFYLTRGVALHESPSCSWEDSLDECGRPCDPLSCLLFSALWLRCNHALLVQETQSAKDLDLTCFTTSLFGDATALSLTRCLTLQDAPPCSRKDPPHECGRPCDTLSCLFFTATMASAEPIHIDAGGSANQGYRFDMLQDVADQVHYMLASGAHVPRVAGGGTCRI